LPHRQADAREQAAALAREQVEAAALMARDAIAICQDLFVDHRYQSDYAANGVFSFGNSVRCPCYFLFLLC
jgi:hypothetical protein